MPTKQKLDCYFTWRSHISTDMGWLRIGALALIAQLIIGYWIYKEFPAFRYLVADEGQLIENHTAVLFLAAFFLAVGLFASNRNRKERKLLLIPALIGFLGFLDEINWGEQFFNLSMLVIKGHKINQLHDFIDLALDIYDQQRRIIQGALILSSVTSVTLLGFPYRHWIARQVSLVPWEPLHFTWALFLCLGLVAVVLDQRFTGVEVAIFFEELFEMNAAFVLILATLATRSHIAESRKIITTAN